MGVLKALATGLLIFALAACASPMGSPASSSTLPTSQPPDATFPSEVAGLPVISVAHAVELLRSGKLDGQAVAVAGYYDEMALPCPYPGRYIGPLESWCRSVAFTDTRAGAQLCQSNGANGMSCGQPSGTNLAPFFMSETSGSAWSWLTGGRHRRAGRLRAHRPRRRRSAMAMHRRDPGRVRERLRRRPDRLGGRSRRSAGGSTDGRPAVGYVDHAQDDARAGRGRRSGSATTC